MENLILGLPRIMHRTPDPSAEHVGAVNYRQETRTRLLVFELPFLVWTITRPNVKLNSTDFLSN